MTVYVTTVTITGGLGGEAMEEKVDHPGAIVLSDLVRRDGVLTEFSPSIQEAKRGDPSTSGSRPSKLVIDLYFAANSDGDAKNVAEAVFGAAPSAGSSYTITWTTPRTP